VRTDFTAEQLADPDTAESEKVLRTCTHCGFCTATCPTYVLLGDELDSPRGRIYLIKDMLARGEATADTVKHIDRCLSCLACMTTCPSGVNYMHLVDHARRWIEQNYRRPWGERGLRRMLGAVLSRPFLFRLALRGAALAKPFARALPSRLTPLFALTPVFVPAASPSNRPQIFHSQGEARRMRVALLPGCAQSVLAPEINEATIRLLTRHGCEVVVARGSGCCGALAHHLGNEAGALGFARANVDAWENERVAAGLDGIVINTSGCGTMVKDYGFVLREDPAYADKAMRIASLARDVTEVIAAVGLNQAVHTIAVGRRRVAYHSACSMQHGQGIHVGPKSLLAEAGFEPLDVPEGHLCCGSAGTYNILQPELAAKLRARKLANLASTRSDLVATGNIGCITQLSPACPVPVVHTVELLDWATGGPPPKALKAA
jgi:glycolate oxidase iron-sulfur subunit